MADITREEIQLIAHSVVREALQDVPTISQVNRIVDDAMIRQAQFYTDREEKRREEYFQQTRSVDEHLRQVEQSNQKVLELVAELRGALPALNEMRSDINSLQATTTQHSAELVRLSEQTTGLANTLFGDASHPDAPPSIYALLTTQHAEEMQTLDSLVVRVSALEAWVSTRRNLEKQAVAFARQATNFIFKSRARFAVVVAASTLGINLLDPQIVPSIIHFLSQILGS